MFWSRSPVSQATVTLVLVTKEDAIYLLAPV